MNFLEQYASENKYNYYEFPVLLFSKWNYVLDDETREEIDRLLVLLQRATYDESDTL